MKVLFIISSLICWGFTSVFAQKNEEFSKHIVVRDKDTLLYRMLKPNSMNPAQKYPLFIHLHGAGERGSDNELQLKYIDTLLLANRDKFPCIAIVPQCPKDRTWMNLTYPFKSLDLPEKMTAHSQMVIELIAQLQQEYPIDANRIYISGISMGGFGTWELLIRYPDLFAGAIPICAGGDTSKVQLIKNIPIWAFHGDQDKVVPPSFSRNMVNGLTKINGNIKYTEFKGVGHDSWFNAFREPELMPWIFSQAKIQKTTQKASPKKRK